MCAIREIQVHRETLKMRGGKRMGGVKVFAVARDRVSDSGRLLRFGRAIFSVHRFFDVPGPIFAKLCHTTRYVLK